MKALVIGLTAIALAYGMLFASAEIGAWEKANAYPFGKMCRSVFTLYADTCR